MISPPLTSNRFTRPYWLRLGLFTFTLLALAFAFLLAYFINRQVHVFITPGRNRNIDLPAEIILPYEEVALTTSDGLKLSSWYIPGKSSNAIILVHGINANRTALLPQALMLREADYHLLMLDLRGHGRSEGSEVTYGYREAFDVQAAADYLWSLPEIEHIGALGTSLGGAAVARAAALDSRLEAVVIESSYSSLPDAVEDAFDDFSVFPKWPFAPLLIALAERRVGIEVSQVNSARDLATLSPRSVLIIHGVDDGLFPLYHAEKMYEAAQAPKDLWIINDLGHGNPAVDQADKYRERVVTFFEEAFE